MSSLSTTAIYPRTTRKIIWFFVFAFAAGGVIQPFLNLYLMEVGLSGTQIGVLHGWTALIAVIITPLIGILADRTQRHRRLLGIIVFLKGMAAPLMLLSSAWIWLVSLVSLRIIAAGAQDALMNRLTIAHLHKNGQSNFGSIRFWGALSFAATSLLAGFAARGNSVGILFPLAGILACLAVFFVTAFPSRITGDLSKQVSLDLRRSLLNPSILSLFLVIFLFTLSRSGHEIFGFVYLAKNLGAENDLIGALGAIGGIAPIPAFYFADWCHNHWGLIWTMALGLVFFILTFIGFALIINPLWAVVLVIFQGFGMAFFLVSLVVILGSIGLPKHAATNQMLAQLTVPGLAGMVAQPISGWLFDNFGGQMLFGLSAVLVLITLAVLFFFSKIILSGNRFTERMGD